ncbi:hypothetical protein [Rossellomorea marisflavi]|uniref:hypothetical protein n=1 Tax=Rossellomorea marisflavi TaxID=189381 RepID=UPI003569EF11
MDQEDFLWRVIHVDFKKSVKREINNRKAWYEKSEVSRHIVKIEDEKYLFVIYLNGWSGIPKAFLAIREDGVLPGFEISKEVVFRVSTYNNIMRFAARDKTGMKDIVRRPIKLMERLEKLLIEYFGATIPESHHLYKELSLLLELSAVMQNNQPTFKRMFEELLTIFKEQDTNHLLTKERFDRVYTIALDWHVLLYKEQRMQLMVHHDLPVIMDYIKGDKKAKKLYKMLKIFHTEKRKKSFEEFLEGVVEKQIGDISKLSYSANDLKQFRLLKEKETTEEFRLTMIPIIRND